MNVSPFPQVYPYSFNCQRLKWVDLINSANVYHSSDNTANSCLVIKVYIICKGYSSFVEGKGKSASRKNLLKEGGA